MRVNQYLEDIVKFLKLEYKLSSWVLDNYRSPTSEDFKKLNQIYENLLVYLNVIYPNKSDVKECFHNKDIPFIINIIKATPLILDERYDYLKSMGKIYNIVYDIKEVEGKKLSASTPFRNAVKLFRASKFRNQIDPKNKGEFTEEDKLFLQKFHINPQDLKSRWSWIDIKPELVPRYYWYVILPKFNYIPKVHDVDKEIGSGFRNSVYYKTGKSLKDVSKEAGVSSYFNKNDILDFFNDKNTPEALLINKLCIILNFSPSDIGEHLYCTRPKIIKPILVRMELMYLKGTYRGFEPGTIELLKNFIEKLPYGNEINDEFLEYMRRRKEKAQKVFQEYIQTKRMQRSRRIVIESAEFDINKRNFNGISDINIKEKINILLKYNRNLYFPIGVFHKNNPRCSNFKIKGNSRDAIRNWSDYIPQIQELINSGDIIINSYIGDVLSKYVIEKEKNTFSFSDEISNLGNVKHKFLLPYILKNHKNAIAIEIFIWKPIYNEINAWFLTGHIDLLLYMNGFIYVVDYKPKNNNFFRTLPQVCCYGLILREMTGINNIKCITFNKYQSWLYDPSIILNGARDIVENIKEEHPSLKLPWKKYF